MFSPLPFDLYFAAQFFLKTGVAEAEVLSRLNLTPTDWKVYATTYGHLWDSNVAQVRRLFPEYEEAELYGRLIGPRWTFPEPSPTLADAARGLRAVVLSAPFLGPFRGAPWVAEHIVDDPVAYLLFYSRDVKTVYFDGKPLADREGKPLELNAPAFGHLGGRFYNDGERILGQGQIGEGGAKRFWWTLTSADHVTFTVLNERYAKDANYAYYITGKVIRTRSPEAFEIVPDLRFDFRSGQSEPIVRSSYVARDREKVYSYGAVVRDADPAHFHAVGQGYWTDGRSVWRDEGKRILQGADATTFLVPGPLDPPIRNTRGAAASDRLQPWDLLGPVPVHEAFEAWRDFFETHSELTGWWWHKAALELEPGSH